VTAPPGIPADRLAALRKAFADTLADPEFIKIADQRKLPVRFTSGEEVERVMKSMIATPKEVIATLKQRLQEAEVESNAKK